MFNSFKNKETTRFKDSSSITEVDRLKSGITELAGNITKGSNRDEKSKVADKSKSKNDDRGSSTMVETNYSRLRSNERKIAASVNTLTGGIKCSKACRRVSYYEDSDSDDPEEIRITKFLNNSLASEIKCIKASKEYKIGIKRSAGYYQLKHSGHAVADNRVLGYKGKHWDVKMPAKLNRATRRLTNHAIDTEVAKEQLRRTKTEMVERMKAVKQLRALHKEFKACLKTSKEEEEENLLEERYQMQLNKDDTLVELMHILNKRRVNVEVEKERKRQCELVEMLSEASENPEEINTDKDSELSNEKKKKSLDKLTTYKDSKNVKEQSDKRSASEDGSRESLVNDLIEMDYLKKIVQRDLLEGFARYEDNEMDTDLEYQDAMMDVMDQSLHVLKHVFRKHVTREMEEAEQIRRAAEEAAMMEDYKHVTAKKNMDNVFSDLHSAFVNVRNEEKKENRRCEQRASDAKEMMLQELRRNYLGRKTAKMCLFERKRRVKEEEKNVKDPKKESMKEFLVKVQRQIAQHISSGTSKTFNSPTKQRKTEDEKGKENTLSSGIRDKYNSPKKGGKTEETKRKEEAKVQVN